MPDLNRAACRALPLDTADVMFFDPCNEAAALAVCHACPLITACRSAALDVEGSLSVYARFGVVGGMTPLDRALAAGVLRHGTAAAWRAGCLCSACATAKPAGAQRQRRTSETSNAAAVEAGEAVA